MSANAHEHVIQPLNLGTEGNSVSTLLSAVLWGYSTHPGYCCGFHCSLLGTFAQGCQPIWSYGPLHSTGKRTECVRRMVVCGVLDFLVILRIMIVRCSSMNL